MGEMSLVDYQAILTLYKDALSAIATGQAYSIGGRSMTRADLKAVRDTIDWCNRNIKRLTNGTGGLIIKGATPVDTR